MHQLERTVAFISVFKTHFVQFVGGAYAFGRYCLTHKGQMTVQLLLHIFFLKSALRSLGFRVPLKVSENKTGLPV